MERFARRSSQHQRGSALSGLIEALAMLAIAGVTVYSAVLAKQSGTMPALAAVEQSPPVVRTEPTVLDPLNTPVEADDAISPTEAGVRYFGGRAVRPARTIWMTVTAYSPDHRSCGVYADGITASGRSVWVNAGELVAADTSLLPFGSLISVPGYAEERVVPVLDVGGAIKGARLDVLYPTHEIALQWGVQSLPVTVWEYVDE